MKLSDKQTKKIEAIVTKSITGGRRYFGSSGAGLSNLALNPKSKEIEGFNQTIAREGLDGEHTTTKKLMSWINEKDNVVLIDSVSIDGMPDEVIYEDGTYDGGDNDHIVVVGRHIFVIDSKPWKGRGGYSVELDGTVLRGRNYFPGGEINPKEREELWTSFLLKQGFRDIQVHIIINITREDVVILRDRNWWWAPVKVVSVENLVEWLEKLYTTLEMNYERINYGLIACLVAHTKEPYDEMKERFPDLVHLLSGE